MLKLPRVIPGFWPQRAHDHSIIWLSPLSHLILCPAIILPRATILQVTMTPSRLLTFQPSVIFPRSCQTLYLNAFVHSLVFAIEKDQLLISFYSTNYKYILLSFVRACVGWNYLFPALEMILNIFKINNTYYKPYAAFRLDLSL